MPSRIFRFYSIEPGTVFRMAGERWPSAVVRRSGWKIGGSAVFSVTLVLDESRAADEFDAWLGRNAPRRDIKRYVERAGRSDASIAYKDVRFHRGGLGSRLKLPISTFRRAFSRNWLSFKS